MTDSTERLEKEIEGWADTWAEDAPRQLAAHLTAAGFVWQDEMELTLKNRAFEARKVRDAHSEPEKAYWAGYVRSCDDDLDAVRALAQPTDGSLREAVDELREVAKDVDFPSLEELREIRHGPPDEKCPR